MGKRIIQAASVITSIAATGAYGFALFLGSFACYGKDIGCAGGWIARTIVTAVYLAVVAGLIGLTRWLLRRR